jgi:multiple sugar transport system substrate-binding protein
VWQCGSSPADGCLGPEWPKLVASFEKANPTITIKTRYVPFDNLDTVFAQALAAHAGPDIADVNSSGEYGLYASKGYLKDLRSTIVGLPNIQASSFYSTLWQQAALKQGTFGIPVDTGTRVLFWNKTLFKNAGLAPFGTTATWSQVLNAAQKISALGNGISGFRYAGGEKWAMLYNNIGPLVFEAGGQFIDPTGTHADATSPAVARAVTYWNQLAKYAPRSDASQQDQAVAMQAFAANKAGMFYNGFWNIPEMKQANPKVKFGETLMQDETVASTTGGWLLTVPSYVPDSKMAAIKKFFSFVYQPKNEAKLTNIIPAEKAAVPLATSIRGPEFNLFYYILNKNARQPIPLTQNMFSQAVDIFQAVQGTTLGQSSVASAMKSLQGQLESSLSQ